MSEDQIIELVQAMGELTEAIWAWKKQLEKHDLIYMQDLEEEKKLRTHMEECYVDNPKTLNEEVKKCTNDQQLNQTKTK